jgi:lipoprotein Spr
MSKNVSFSLAFSLLILVACGPQPRYTSAPLEKKEHKEAPAGETGEGGESKIDKAKMSRIIDSFVGTPYEYGGEAKSGIDCSGLVKQVYKQYAGFDLPHDTKKLYKLVKHVEEKDLVYGDLVFFSDGWFSVSHVGIYVGERSFVHSAERFGVIVSSLEEGYYRKRYRGARRVIP